MRLCRIKMNNFRQFYGEQSIEFASGNKNITIIFGENGKGKTGIYRALTFALFGETYLSQDNKKDVIHLVNFNMLEENKGIPVTAKVEVEIEQNGINYIIERTIQGYKMNNIIEERILSPKLITIDEDGNYGSNIIEDEIEIRSIISSIMDEKIKDFFLFDGEKIETLAKTDASIKEEVKTGIVKLLQIDKLDKSISIVNNLYSKENRKLVEKSSNLNLRSKKEEIDLKEELINSIEEKIEIKKYNITACQKEIEENEAKLAEHEGIREIQDKIKNVKEKRGFKRQTLNLLKENLKENYFGRSHMILMRDVYPMTKAYLNQILVQQKDIVSFEVIEKSLKESRCTCCGTNLLEHKDALNYVNMLKENYKRSEMTPVISQINGTIYDFEINKNEITNGIKNKLIEVRKTKDEINEYDRNIERLEKEIEKYSSTASNLNEIERLIKEKIKLKEETSAEVNKLEASLDVSVNELANLKGEYGKLLEEDTSLKFDYKKLGYIESLKSSLLKIFNEYSDEMREKIMEETTKTFKKLIDSKDRDIVENIKINEKYEIELYNWLGTKITQDISQGQRQIISLSFITALAKVAAGDREHISFPLFMDTPFGRISGNNRDNLIENIPNLTAQWILLLTDTEFTISEEMKFKGTERLGAWYKLEQVKPGQTNIVKIDLCETMATRR